MPAADEREAIRHLLREFSLKKCNTRQFVTDDMISVRVRLNELVIPPESKVSVCVLDLTMRHYRESELLPDCRYSWSKSRTYADDISIGIVQRLIETVRKARSKRLIDVLTR